MEKEYIEREALIKTIFPIGMPNNGNYGINAKAVKVAIEKQPAADVVEVVHGEWIENKIPFCNVCPFCGLVIDRTCIKMQSGALNLCPNCGAKMDGGKNEN